MSKGYTKQEVLEWQGWAEKRKAIGHIEYEVFLRNGSEDGEFYVDVRKDIVDSNNDVVNGGEYIEGEIFDDYGKAKEKFSQFVKEYLETGDIVGENNEVEMDRMAEKERRTMKFKVTFTDIVEAKTEREAYENFMTYIRECAKYSDLEAFEFDEIKE